MNFQRAGDGVESWLEEMHKRVMSRPEPQRQRDFAADAQRAARERILRDKQRTLPLAFRFVYVDGGLRRTEALDATEAFSRRPGKCLVLMGPPGVGKTYAAARWLLVQADTPGRFYLFAGLRRRVLDLETRKGTIETAISTPLLVLDDFGKEYRREGGFADAFLEELFIEREANARATVLTSNLCPADLRERFSPAILDRLNGPWAEKFWCGGESLRRREGEGGQ